jgi:hypothetical protein
VGDTEGQWLGEQHIIAILTAEQAREAQVELEDASRRAQEAAGATFDPRALVGYCLEPNSSYRALRPSNGHWLAIVEVQPECVEVCMLQGKIDSMEIEELHRGLVSLASTHYIGELRLQGRRGWSRKLKGLGWKPLDNQLICEVKHG